MRKGKRDRMGNTPNPPERCPNAMPGVVFKNGTLTVRLPVNDAQCAIQDVNLGELGGPHWAETHTVRFIVPPGVRLDACIPGVADPGEEHPLLGTRITTLFVDAKEYAGTVWDVLCLLMRCKAGGATYALRHVSLDLRGWHNAIPLDPSQFNLMRKQHLSGVLNLLVDVRGMGHHEDMSPNVVAALIASFFPHIGNLWLIQDGHTSAVWREALERQYSAVHLASSLNVRLFAEDDASAFHDSDTAKWFTVRAVVEADGMKEAWAKTAARFAPHQTGMRGSLAPFTGNTAQSVVNFLLPHEAMNLSAAVPQMAVEADYDGSIHLNHRLAVTSITAWLKAGGMGSTPAPGAGQPALTLMNPQRTDAGFARVFTHPSHVAWRDRLHCVMLVLDSTSYVGAEDWETLLTVNLLELVLSGGIPTATIDEFTVGLKRVLDSEGSHHRRLPWLTIRESDATGVLRGHTEAAKALIGTCSGSKVPWTGLRLGEGVQTQLIEVPQNEDQSVPLAIDLHVLYADNEIWQWLRKIPSVSVRLGVRNIIHNSQFQGRGDIISSAPSNIQYLRLHVHALMCEETAVDLIDLDNNPGTLVRNWLEDCQFNAGQRPSDHQTTLCLHGRVTTMPYLVQCTVPWVKNIRELFLHIQRTTFVQFAAVASLFHALYEVAMVIPNGTHLVVQVLHDEPVRGHENTELAKTWQPSHDVFKRLVRDHQPLLHPSPNADIERARERLLGSNIQVKFTVHDWLREELEYLAELPSDRQALVEPLLRTAPRGTFRTPDDDGYRSEDDGYADDDDDPDWY